MTITLPKNKRESASSSPDTRNQMCLRVDPSMLRRLLQIYSKK